MKCDESVWYLFSQNMFYFSVFQPLVQEMLGQSKFSTVREGGKALSRFSRETVGAPFLEVFKDRLNEALSNLV